MMRSNLIEHAEDLVAVMNSIVIEHPRMTEVYSRYDTLIASARRNPSGEKSCMPLVAPPGSGKTTITKTFAEKHNTKEALESGRIPILHVTLKAPATRKSFAQDILIEMQKFGWETDPFKGTENVLQERIREYLGGSKTDLLVVDEFQHLVLNRADRDGNVSRTVGEMVKWMLIKGVCPIVVSGTDEAMKPFRANPQLVRRSIPSVSLAPLSATSSADKKLYTEFLARYLHELERRDVAKNAKALLLGDIPACLLETSQGILGGTCSILETAVRLMAYDSRSEFQRDDLARAVDAFVIDAKCERNPFRQGLKPLRLAA